MLAACGSAPTTNTSSFPSTPYPTASTSPSTYPANTTYPSAQVSQSTPPAAVEYGRVTDVQTVMGNSGDPNAARNRAIAGGVIGAVVGNVIGKNVNNGNNRSAATVLGAGAGAMVGNRSGQNAQTASTTQAYRVTVQTDQGATRTFEVPGLGDLRVGDRVRVENGVIYRA
jgi:uncharacterized protein YcfJ